MLWDDRANARTMRSLSGETMAADPTRQLSLVDGSEQQGQLFDLGGFNGGPARGTPAPRGSAPPRRGQAAEVPAELDRDSDLEAEGRSRPRRHGSSPGDADGGSPERDEIGRAHV